MSQYEIESFLGAGLFLVVGLIGAGLLLFVGWLVLPRGK